MRSPVALLAPLLLLLLLVVPACGPSALVAGGEGLDAASIPASLQMEYKVFAHRCSKCHSLARPLNSGIVDDAFWARYVARMRRQPASGISQEDEVLILRFLSYYSAEQKRKAGGDSSDLRDSTPAVPALATHTSGGERP
jgi:hypothetical protein